MNSQSTPASDRLLPLNRFGEMLGYRSRTSVYKDLAEKPDFPRPIRRGRNVLFLESEALSYIRTLAEGRDDHSNAKAREQALGLVEKRRAKALRGVA